MSVPSSDLPHIVSRPGRGILSITDRSMLDMLNTILVRIAATVLLAGSALLFTGCATPPEAVDEPEPVYVPEDAALREAPAEPPGGPDAVVAARKHQQKTRDPTRTTTSHRPIDSPRSSCRRGHVIAPK
jgi:hypothetical protein